MVQLRIDQPRIRIVERKLREPLRAIHRRLPSTHRVVAQANCAASPSPLSVGPSVAMRLISSKICSRIPPPPHPVWATRKCTTQMDHDVRQRHPQSRPPTRRLLRASDKAANCLLQTATCRQATTHKIPECVAAESSSREQTPAPARVDREMSLRGIATSSGSETSTGGGSGCDGILPKYLSTSARASALSKSPTTVSTALFGA